MSSGEQPVPVQAAPQMVTSGAPKTPKEDPCASKKKDGKPGDPCANKKDCKPSDPCPPKAPPAGPPQIPGGPKGPAPVGPASEPKGPATLEVPEAKKICVEQKIMWPDIQELLEIKFTDLEQAQYAVENAKSLYIRMHDQLEIVETDMRRLRNLLISVDTTELKLAKPLNLCPIGKKADKVEGVRRKII